MRENAEPAIEHEQEKPMVKLYPFESYRGERERQAAETDKELQKKEKFEQLLKQSRGVQSELIPLLHKAQAIFGYLPKEVLLRISKELKMPASRVFGVASFYAQFHLTPPGKNVIRICKSAPCHVAGIDRVIAALEQELGIKMGETTPDGKFSLEFTECVGQCQKTPVITINGTPFVNVRPDKIKAILAQY